MKILLLAVALLATPARAAEQRIECPERYPAEDIILPQTGKWDAGLVPARIPLAGGGMMLGPFSQRGELHGSERRIKGGTETRFGFNGAQDPEKWFICHYGHVQLARRVPEATTACTVTHEERKFPQDPKVWASCR